MEAKCLHDFNATADDELSFCRGTVIKVGKLANALYRAIISMWWRNLWNIWFIAHASKVWNLMSWFRAVQSSVVGLIFSFHLHISRNLSPIFPIIAFTGDRQGWGRELVPGRTKRSRRLRSLQLHRDAPPPLVSTKNSAESSRRHVTRSRRPSRWKSPIQIWGWGVEDLWSFSLVFSAFWRLNLHTLEFHNSASFMAMVQNWFSILDLISRFNIIV